MLDLFEITAGTIPGRRHVGRGNLLVGRNNQDAYGVIVDSAAMVITVFDGCGSGAHTEVGAKLASKMVPTVIAEAYKTGRLPPAGSEAQRESWNEIKKALVSRLYSIALQMIGPAHCDAWNRMVSEYMLFTIFGALVTRTHTTVFSIGDGVYSINGELRTVGPFTDNAPPYIGYALMAGQFGLCTDFAIHETLPTSTIDSLVVGTDGVVELGEKTGMRLPGKEVAVCPVADLSNDNFFAADQSLTCWLRQVNSEVVRLDGGREPRINRAQGLLDDDTTLVVARRRR